MKRILTLTVFLAALCLLAACDKQKKQSQGPNHDIAMEIFQLIPKSDLPDYCVKMGRNAEQDSTYGVPFDPRGFSSSVQGSEIDLDGGLFASLVFHCYPLSTGGWRAYWVTYAGFDGLCGYDHSGAYNYVDGELTPEPDWTLPCPPATELIDYAHWDYDEAEKSFIAERPNYLYTFYDDHVDVTIDLDYLTYGLEGDADDLPDLPAVAIRTYTWNGTCFE